MRLEEKYKTTKQMNSNLIEVLKDIKEENKTLKDMVDYRVKYCNELEEKLIKAVARKFSQKRLLSLQKSLSLIEGQKIFRIYPKYQ